MKIYKGKYGPMKKKFQKMELTMIKMATLTMFMAGIFSEIKKGRI